MRVRIDIIFLDAQSRVLRVCANVPGGRLAIICYRAHAVIELGSGALQRGEIALRDRLELIADGPQR